MTCPACLRAKSLRIRPEVGAGSVTDGIRDQALRKGIGYVWINGKRVSIERNR